MRLRIISFAVFAVCFGLFGCTNARDSGNDHEMTSMRSSSYNQNESTNVLLLVTESRKIFSLQHSTKDVDISEYQNENYSTLLGAYQNVNAFTSTCVNKNIYILKDNIIRNEFLNKKMLEVIHYNENNKLERIKQVENMFDDTISIASDYMTGKIYWVKNYQENYSIKVTDKSFKKSEYVHRPTRKSMSKLQAYPKRNKLIFLSDDSLWYTSNLPNSTPHELFSSNVNVTNITDFTIDYITNKLCWIQNSDNEFHLYCAGMGNLNRPLKQNEIFEIGKIPKSIDNLVAFNNTFYWTAYENDIRKLYFKNGHETAVEKAGLQEKSFISIVPSICPTSAAKKQHIKPLVFPTYPSPKKNQNQEPALSDNQNNSTNVLLVITDASKILTSQYSTDVNLEYQIEGHSITRESYPLVTYFTSSCLDHNIYILKQKDLNRMFLGDDDRQMLEVIRYNKNNKFEIINQKEDMFNGATSVASDYMTGRIYWTELVINKYSIKFTDESFNKLEYIIHPTSDQSMLRLQIYPKRSKIFFLSEDERIWYVSTSANSTANLLFSSKKFRRVLQLTIDYMTDKLCWVDDYDGETHLDCIVIGTLDRPLNPDDIETIAIIPNQINHFVAFNNTFYWTAFENNQYKLYFKNGKNADPVKKADLQEYGFLSIVPSICPSAQKMSAKNNKVPHSSTKIDIPKQEQEQSPADKQKESKNYLLVTDSNKILKTPFSTIKDVKFSTFQIKNHPIRSGFNNDLIAFNSYCANNNIYMLRDYLYVDYPTYNEYKKRKLDVIRYNENNEFNQINQVENMFNNALSIASDWVTGQIYWIERDHNNKSSIKATDKSFINSVDIIRPTDKMDMKKLQVYPKRGEIFFSTQDGLWCISNLRGSSAISLLSGLNFGKIFDFTIDYETDNLCWIAYFNKNYILFCVDINNFDRPLNAYEIVLFGTSPMYFDQLIAFNNTFYYAVHENNERKLYRKNGKSLALEVGYKLRPNDKLSFVSLTCPYFI